MQLFWQQFVNPSPAGRRWMAVAAVALVGAIGYLDYRTGYEASWLIFYFLPVCLAVTALGWRFGALISVASVATWLAGDSAAGMSYSNPLLPAWNVLIALGSYLVVVALFSNLLALHRQLEQRVRERTAALTTEIAERTRLEKLILEIGERERRGLGHDLHDGLGQHLTGTSLAGQVLTGKLEAAGAEEAEDARRIVALIEEAIEQTRRLARGLALPEIGHDGLSASLRELARTTADQARVACDFRSDGSQDLDEGRALHLFRLAQEAVSNALRHGKADRIAIDLSGNARTVTLQVSDNGLGLPPPEARGRGLGLHIMGQRAAILGGTLAVEARAGGGTAVTCRVPLVRP